MIFLMHAVTHITASKKKVKTAVCIVKRKYRAFLSERKIWFDGYFVEGNTGQPCACTGEQ